MYHGTNMNILFILPVWLNMESLDFVGNLIAYVKYILKITLNVVTDYISVSTIKVLTGRFFIK